MKIRVRITPPKARWVRFDLEAGDDVFQEDFWAIPVDVVYNLVSAIAAIAEGRPSATAEASAESVGRYMFLFEVSSDDMLNLRIEHWPSWTNRTTGGRVRFELHAAKIDILLAFWRGLQDMRGRTSGAEFEREWGSPLPMDVLDHLSTLLRTGR